MNSEGTQAVRFSVVLFDSISAVLRAEKLLQAAKIPLKLIPVPKQLSSDCGVCIRFGGEDQEQVAAILKSNDLPVRGIFVV